MNPIQQTPPPSPDVEETTGPHDPLDDLLTQLINGFFVLTDGRAATEWSHMLDRPVATFDLARDYATCSRLALAPADQTGAEQLQSAIGLLQSAGIAAAVDTAMRLGVNYPQGPLAWAEEIGLKRVLEVLDHLRRSYAEERYRASWLLRRKVLAKARFHG